MTSENEYDESEDMLADHSRKATDDYSGGFVKLQSIKYGEVIVGVHHIQKIIPLVSDNEDDKPAVRVFLSKDDYIDVYGTFDVVWNSIYYHLD